MPVRLYDEADVHEEVTVARELPDIAAYLGAHGKNQLGKTIVDLAPPKHAPAPALARSTPVVPAAGQPAPAADQPGVVKTQMMMSKTLNDPVVEARAEELRDARLGSATTSPQAPPAALAKSNQHKTMVMGGESVPFPPTHPPPVAPATSPPPPTSPPANVGSEPPRADASPLSRSVLAPHSWSPPPPAQAPIAGIGVDVARVVSVGTPAPEPPPPPPTATPPQQPSRGAPALRTMMGMPASDLLPPAGAMPERAPPPPAAQKTMMGVAIPGIAPLQTGAGAPPGAGGGPIDLRSKQSTMLGVAIPGIAPSQPSEPQPQGHPQPGRSPQGQGQQQPYAPYGLTPPGLPAPAPHMPSQVQNTALGMMAAPELVLIVPRPKTLIDEPLPVAPVIPEKRGIPALAVVGIVAALVAVLGGVGAYLALRNGATLTAVPQLDENGRESLKIGCATCPDGTTVALGASSATVTAGAAVLPLPAPLSIGDNTLGVKIDRPGAGRDEEVKVHVPVAYRVRADLATLSAKPSVITVRVEAVPGSDVKVEEHPVTLDDTGRGAYVIDLGKVNEGTGEASTFERKIPFVITPKGGAAQPGQLTARTGILPLALDAPGSELYTDKTTAAVAGQTRPGSTVTIDGTNVPVDAQGRFGVRVELANVGEKSLEIIAASLPQAPRIAKVKVVRVASLAETSKELEGQTPLTFDAFGTDAPSKIGQKVVVEGDVVDVRASGGHSVLLIDTKRGCAKGATCLVRIVHGEEDKVARGDNVRAYGKILGNVTASGKTVPEVEASLVLPVKATK